MSLSLRMRMKMSMRMKMRMGMRMKMRMMMRMRRFLRNTMRQSQSLRKTVRPLSQQVSQGIPPLAITPGGLVAIPVPQAHIQTLCVCSESLTTLHTPFPGILELWAFPPEMDKRFSGAEDTKTHPKPVRAMAVTGTGGASSILYVLAKAYLVFSVVATLLIALAVLLWGMVPAVTKCTEK